MTSFSLSLSLLNGLLGVIGGWFQSPEGFLWFIFLPLAFAIRVPWREAVQAGSYTGQKLK